MMADIKKIPKEKIEDEAYSISVDVSVTTDKIEKANNLTTSAVGKITGVRYETLITLLENPGNNRLSTLLKILLPFGYTLAVVPKNERIDEITEEIQELAERVKASLLK